MTRMVLILFCALAYIPPLWSFTCYFTLAKDSCWANYNVFVDVIDVASDTTLMNVELPKGTQWTRQTFDCKPAQELMYYAHFTPVFWKNDEGKKFPALRYWFMPEKINPGDTAWEVKVCFSSDFASVPMPPDVPGNCKCDFSTIPVIPPGK